MAIPLKHRNITLERFEKFLSRDYWTEINLRGHIYSAKAPLAELSHFALPSNGVGDFARAVRPAFADVVGTHGSAQFTPAAVGDAYGPTWATHWFKLRATVPAEFVGQEVHLRWDFEGEGLLYAGEDMVLRTRAGDLAFAAGDAIVAFTGGGGDDALWRQEMELVATAAGGESFQFFVEAACNGMFGSGGGGMIAPPDVDRRFPLNTAEVAVFDRRAWRMFVDFTLVHELAAVGRPDGAGFGLSEGGSWDATAAEALFVGNEFLNRIDMLDRDTWDEAGQLLATFLVGHRSEAGGAEAAPAFAAAGGSRGAGHVVSAVGHCHIDTAWLWPYAETRRKIARSWASQLVLLQQYERAVFTASSAQQFAWLKADQPALFARVKAAVAAGRFVPTGGTWVEMDANLPSGESLARQFLLGQRFFRREFGQASRTFWLPDTFGYAANLPQIMRLSGIDYFLTQKLSWSLVNSFPHTTFAWEGLDGSDVLTHFPPTDTYNARVSVDELRKHNSCAATGKGNKDLERFGCDAPSLMLYGHGDGGGGPDKLMHARLERLGSLRGGTSLPRVEHANPDAFFDQLAARAVLRPAARWVGELYLELHQGTFTSQAKTKRNNRAGELALHDIELFSVVARLAAAAAPAAPPAESFAYPAAELQRLWEGVLLHQFHDVIPGSSIEMVYDDVDDFFEGMLGAGGEAAALLRRALGSLFSHSLRAAATELPLVAAAATATAAAAAAAAVAAAAATAAAGASAASASAGERKRKRGAAGLVLANSLAFEREEVVDLQGGGLKLVCVPAAGWATLAAAEPAAVASSLRAVTVDRLAEGGGFVLENAALRVEVTESGAVRSLVDKRALPPRECVAEGALANVFKLYSDVPFFWDAWDTMPYHLETGKALNDDSGALRSVASVVLAGPLRCSLRFEFFKAKKEGKPGAAAAGGEEVPWMSLSVQLDAGSSTALEFALDVDWQEKHKFLKVEHNLAVRSPYATYDTQFGCLQRPTHANTSWDWSKYEVCAHKWCDLSEMGCGVAMLNDSKYGHSCRGSTLALSLLRSPKAPDAHCDMGRQVARWALMPHAGFPSVGVASDVIRAAERFNSPIAQALVYTDAALGPSSASYFGLEALTPGLCVCLSAVKDAEDNGGDGGGCLVVRVFEGAGGRGRARLRSSALVFKEARTCNLLEDDDAVPDAAVALSIGPAGEFVEFTVRPFQIVSLKLVAEHR